MARPMRFYRGPVPASPGWAIGGALGNGINQGMQNLQRARMQNMQMQAMMYQRQAQAQMMKDRYGPVNFEQAAATRKVHNWMKDGSVQVDKDSTGKAMPHFTPEAIAENPKLGEAKSLQDLSYNFDLANQPQNQNTARMTGNLITDDLKETLVNLRNSGALDKQQLVNQGWNQREGIRGQYSLQRAVTSGQYKSKTEAMHDAAAQYNKAVGALAIPTPMGGTGLNDQARAHLQQDADNAREYYKSVSTSDPKLWSQGGQQAGGGQMVYPSSMRKSAVPVGQYMDPGKGDGNVVKVTGVDAQGMPNAFSAPVPRSLLPDSVKDYSAPPAAAPAAPAAPSPGMGANGE